MPEQPFLKGKALLTTELGSEFKIEQVELDGLQDEEVLVRLIATGICHTDLAVATGKIPVPHPLVAGHEGAGIVEKIGSKVRNVEVNDHVILTFASCGSCPSCSMNRPFCCVHSKSLNFSGHRPDGSKPIRWGGEGVSSSFFGQSSFCNPAIVQSRCCVRIDPSYPLERLAALGCSIQTGAGAILNIVKSHRPEVTSVAVLGLGGVGCAAIMAAKLAGIPTIIAIDVQPNRLSIAKHIGATHTINSSEVDLKTELLKIGGGIGPGAIVECTGVPAVVQSFLHCVGPAGLALSVGAPGRDVVVTINVANQLRRSLTYRGTHEGDSNPAEFIPILAKYWADGLLPLDHIQKYYRVDDINKAVSAMNKGETIKAVILWEQV